MKKRPRQTTVRWDKEADIVIAGYGATGAAAAIEASDAGASVTILEKMSRPGGDTLLSGGVVYGSGTSIQKARGIEDNSDEMLKYLEAVGGELINRELTSVMAQMSGEDIEWLIKLGVKFNPELLCFTGLEELPEYAAVTAPKERGHVVQERTGRGLMGPLEKAIKERDIEVMLNTPLQLLVTDPNTREVLGIKSEKLTVRAKRAVILATGGFTRNEQMFKSYLTPYIGTLKMSAAGITGDGIKAAQALGADLLNMGLFGVTPGVAMTIDSPTGRIAQSSAAIIVSLKTAPCILVNKRGQRFADEYTAQYHRLGAIIAALEGRKCFCIFDEDTRRSGGQRIFVPRLSDDLSEEIEKGIVKKAYTIKELANKLGIDADALQNTVSTFNENVVRGVDPHFGRTIHMVPLKTSPFYAMEVTASGSTTFGGLRINTRCQVVDVFEKVIPRLYAGGEAVGGRVGEHYPGSGYHLMTCFALGRIAGRIAAAEKPWI